jgi:hypothetical protein
MMRGAARSFTLAVTAALAAAACAVAAPENATPVRLACYPAQFGSWHVQTRTLADKLSFARDAASVSIGAPQTVCATASGSSSGYLTCYAAKSRTIPESTYNVTDEFGRSLSVTAQALGSVCLSSTRADQGGSASAPASKSLLSCYTAKASVPARSGVAVSDTFGTSKDSLGALVGFCSPAGWKLPAPDGGFLTCYADQTATTGTVVVLQNEFGYLKAALGPRGWLCTSASFAGGSGVMPAYSRTAR